MIDEYAQFVKSICSKLCNTEDVLQLCYQSYGLSVKMLEVKP